MVLNNYGLHNKENFYNEYNTLVQILHNVHHIVIVLCMCQYISVCDCVAKIIIYIYRLIMYMYKGSPSSFTSKL